ncbi:IS66 family insertion sequence element accessory protein TnpB [Bradyrhizobium sp. 76]|uniref:IS66 family insertion sequence element accessory protein TnpB n=1 Tax=Bradyrhizobium sp. 76 TaxID=2782680 RepID=UPI001FFA24E8|nr:IS66 family insertion sequence element accessory protein TnpB [Bradyrhizobium sp. 76]
MIPIPSGDRVWIATGHIDMRRGMQSLALAVQESLKRDPHAGDFYIFRGRRGDLVKILWHDGLGMSLYAKRLDRGKFIWPSASAGTGVDLGGADGLYAGRNRPEESSTNVAARERGLSKRKLWGAGHFGESQRIQSAIHCVTWMLSAKRFRMTLPP